MRIKKNNTGVFIEGKEIISIELENTKGTYVKLFNYGAILNKFIINNYPFGKQDIVLGFDSIEQYLTDTFYIGSIVGRYANRVKNGQFSIDGNLYNLTKNSGPNSIHGGTEGFNKKIWEIVSISENPNTTVTMKYLSIDGEENYPGNLEVYLTFELTENEELTLTYKAITDKATAVNLTHHSYFNLATKIKNIGGHKLQIFANNYLEQDNSNIPTGKLIPVTGTHLDFTKLKHINKDWESDNGYDQTFVLDKEYSKLTLACKVIEEDSKLALEVYTTEPALHFYTSKYLKSKNGKGGVEYNEFDAFCLETQHYPNSINLPNFPSTILRRGETYFQKTIYRTLSL